MVWGTYRFRKHATLQNGKKWPKKKVPQSARLSAGGGGQIAIWAMPKCRGHQTKWVLPIGQWHIVVLHGDIIYDIIYDNSSWSELH